MKWKNSILHEAHEEQHITIILEISWFVLVDLYFWVGFFAILSYENLLLKISVIKKEASLFPSKGFPLDISEDSELWNKVIIECKLSYMSI